MDEWIDKWTRMDDTHINYANTLKRMILVYGKHLLLRLFYCSSLVREEV